jgi:predicted MPP superfamily phosphohydrolase
VASRRLIRRRNCHIRINCDVVVSGGVGRSYLPFRFGVPPEIVLVTLGGSDSALA